MSSNFRLKGYRRRVMGRVVDVAGPSWDEFKVSIRDDVLDDLEGLIRGYPPMVRFGIVCMLLVLEFGGPLTLTGWLPFSFLSDDAGKKRFERLLHHRVPLVRNIPKFLKIIVSISAYGRPEVEEFLGAPRRGWRAQRREFRAQLVQIEAGQPRPKTPQALGGHALAAPEDYLDYKGDATRTAGRSMGGPS